MKHNSDLTKEDFFRMVTKHSKIMNYVIRTVMLFPDYTVTSEDVVRITGIDQQRARDVLNDLRKLGFLRKIGTRGKKTVYRPVVDKETLESWIKEYYGLS